MIILKPAEKKDASVLYMMLQKMAQDLGKSNDFLGSIKSIETAGFSEPPAFYSIIAWHDDVAVGFILFFFEYSTWTASHGIYVQDLFVDSSARGAGLAKRLTCAAVKQGKTNCNASYMRLAVHDDNDQGAGFYQKMGFKPVNDETVMALKGDAFHSALAHATEGNPT
jgi:ribosomal protein S18 acetylase RimI-like enzyme